MQRRSGLRGSLQSFLDAAQAEYREALARHRKAPTPLSAERLKYAERELDRLQRLAAQLRAS